MIGRTGVLGGTFDPIHAGHVEVALAVQRALALDRMLIVPSHTPPHRATAPAASPWHRFAMAAMVTVDLPGVLTTDVELQSPAPSYTANTLERLIVDRQSALQFFFITGADAFAEIETWWRYPDVLDLCHFVVISRPAHPAGALRARLPGLAARMIEIDARPPQVDELASPRILLLDLPTPDISSTRIRHRAARGEPLDGLVPPPALAHILKHGLYRAEGAAAGLQE